MSNKQKQRNKSHLRESKSVAFSINAWEDYQHWKTADQAMSTKVDDLINDCLRSPFKGIGKPEALKGDFTGLWSRRINKEHRLVYMFEADRLSILQCRYHYDD
jgi:toxin YoeB